MQRPERSSLRGLGIARPLFFSPDAGPTRYRVTPTRTAYGAGSGVQDATTSCAAMRHRKAAAMVWSRFETARAMETAMSGTPRKVYEVLTQGLGRRGRTAS